MNRRLAPSVNAGSMADIAFLLLIFFLVTTTIQSESGISRKLPSTENIHRDVSIKKRNLFEIELNRENELLVEGVPMELLSLKMATIAFLDNGGGKNIEYCTYCKGAKDPYSSDHPNKAVISLGNSRNANYAAYIAVQNELKSAYTTLRNREAKRLFDRTYTEMKSDLNNVNFSGNKTTLKKRIKKIQSMYPEKIYEAEHIDDFNK
ncbi:ExbD/TolR family protein [Aquimarina sp. 2304DJ70-9]|uniref:ExbD/TolR family protein n=1 Tax=Aquimarina penaris TaxID=3231044 RepID=UPI00346223BB